MRSARGRGGPRSVRHAPAHAARHAVHLLRRRDRHAHRSAAPSRRGARSGRPHVLAGVQGTRRRAAAYAVGRRHRARVLDRAALAALPRRRRVPHCDGTDRRRAIGAGVLSGAPPPAGGLARASGGRVSISGLGARGFRVHSRCRCRRERCNRGAEHVRPRRRARADRRRRATRARPRRAGHASRAGRIGGPAGARSAAVRRRGDCMTLHSRRSWLRSSVMGPIGVALWRSRTLDAAIAQRGTAVDPKLAGVRALVFDVFGTVVDWRSSVTAEMHELATRKDLTVDGAKYADAWRAGYGPRMNRVRTGELPWTKLDELHRMTLDRILGDFGITSLSEAEKDHLNRAWHRLKPWPDSVSGLTRLKKKFIVA